MFVSILITALTLHFSFYYLEITPETGAALGETAQFGLDYTFYLNLGALLLVGLNLYLAHLHQRHYREGRGGHHRWMWAGEQDWWSLQSFVAYLMISILPGGLLTYFLSL